MSDFSKVLGSFYVYTGDYEDYFIQRQCRIHGVWDVELTEWMKRTLQPGWVCLDIGANIGYFTELMARIVGKDGRVIAFEPNSHLYSKYLEASSLNNYANSAPIEMNNVGLSDSKGYLTLHVNMNNVGNATMSREVVALNPMASYTPIEAKVEALSDYSIDKIDFIKVDVEGFEEHVFKGFSESAKSCPLIVIELNNWASYEFVSFLLDTYTFEDYKGAPVSEEEVRMVASRVHTKDFVLRLK